MDREESISAATLVSSPASSIQSLGLDAHNDVATSAGLQVTCFTEFVDDVTPYFQIIRLPKQSTLVSASSILRCASDNTGFGIARRLVLKTGLSIILACNIPKNSPMLEASAEEKLIEELISLGYIRQKPRALSS